MSTVLPASHAAGENAAVNLSGRRAIVVSTIGNALEWFDFMVYGFFAVIISKLYFPATSPTISLLATWATFGVGFLTRRSAASCSARSLIASGASRRSRSPFR